MDVSSGCWPSDSTNSASGGENNNNSNTNLAVASSKDRCRKKSMNDSGKCSNLGRHDEEEFQFDSLDAQINNNNNNNGTTPIANGDDRQDRTRLNDFNSPVHKRNYKAYNLNIANKNLPAVNPVVYNLMNNNNSGGSNASSGTNLSSNSINNNNNNNNSFKDTNSDASRTSENLTQIFNNSGNNNGDAAGAKRKVPIEMITKSMQTSFIGTKEKVSLDHFEII